MNLNEQKITPECLEKAADQVEDKREEYKEVLLQLKKMLGGSMPHSEMREKLTDTYEQMKEYALFVQSIEAFLRSSARNLKVK
ncbi:MULTISPECIES: hypothetical protein [Bacillus]|uniref:hypothetical protein n=1 Tax=Bacillus TaxID=1386 RepID=UPI000779A65C|nr:MULTISPECIES: hypothetical protein [Bacillus]MBT2624967.1 hypothetical protein [Bacillus sp. ISL-32]KAA6450101.1 hypothetical protein DX926_11530 [Bacillus atrophaeus]KYD03963.1 hypothetical protein B4144_4246 [Bacillus atrophaeus]MCG8396311.1 hypothetical protein [Bacillus atrophaeus]MCI3195385.1 hypothetical protein [Bacillus sp. HU-1818]